jgi:signal transduction histidine kinase
MAYTEFLLDNAKKRGAADDEDMLQRLQSNALVIHALVSNYLDLSRVESGRLTLNKQPFLLNELLEKIESRLAGEARLQSISLALHKPDKSPVVEGDIASLERVFSNLLHNALKFTPELGHVEIRVTQHDGEAAVSIFDSGPGILPDELPTVFDKYRQGTHQREGAGLGLFIVKTFIEAHGGRVEVESTLGEGSCFTVRLPTVTDEEVFHTKEALI